MNSKIKTRKKTYAGHAFNLEALTVELPNGKTCTYDLVSHRDSVTIVPVDNEGNIWFVEQFRMGSGSILLELPAGVLEKGEKPLDCAKREIREEIGMGAAKWKKLGSYYLAPGYSSELNHAFLATVLYPSPLEQDKDEFINIRKMPIAIAYEQAKTGKIMDAKSIAALFLSKETT